MVKGADTTTLTESKTVVAYGNENEERLSVRVLSATTAPRPARC
jgi:hypothetical protein